MRNHGEHNPEKKTLVFFSTTLPATEEIQTENTGTKEYRKKGIHE
jgi:hypothetical protein